MTNYSEDDASVRCEIFKPGGKWEYSFALNMEGFWEAGSGPYEAVEEAIKKDGHWSRLWYSDYPWIFVVLDPYHRHAYPVLLHSPGQER